MGKHAGRHSIPVTFVAGFPVREIRPGYWLVDFMIDGKRVRQGYGNLADAETFCKTKRLEITRKGTQVLDLPNKVREEALEALRMLEGTGASLLAAVREYVRRHPTTAGETVAETCDRYLANMRANGRREISIKEKEWKFNALRKEMGNLQTRALSVADMDLWSRKFKGVMAPKHLGAGKSLLAFFRGELKQRRKTDEKPPVTWDVAVVANLFAKAEDHTPDLVPALAVLFFAGLRPFEMLRLTWHEIDLDARVIRLTGDQTKTRTMRHVEISDNLLAWLTAYRGTGPVVETLGTYRGQRETLMEKCKVKRWPVDVARHTFATMHYNAHQDAAATMAQLGHFGNPQTFVTYYKGVQAAAEDVTAYWEVKPMKNRKVEKALAFKAAG